MDDNEDTSFADFVHSRSPALLRTAYLLTGDQHLAEDLVQDALARTHRARRRLVAEGHFEAYTRTAMYHLHISRWRRRRRLTETPLDASPDIADPDGDHASHVNLRLSLQRGLAGLTRAQRAVLVLRFLEDRSAAETAAVLHCSVGTVKSQTSKALARLRVLVPELHEQRERKEALR
ncbi:MAG: SigE family RNA polymerase sigma factor [Actinocatenispora sp.]